MMILATRRISFMVKFGLNSHAKLNSSSLLTESLSNKVKSESFSLSAKNECLKQLKEASQLINSRLVNLNWILHERRIINRIPKVHLFQTNRQIVQAKREILQRLSPNLVSSLSENIDNLTVSEKAAVFRTLAILNPPSGNLTGLLLKLEDEYFGNSISQCGLVELINYDLGFAFHDFKNAAQTFRSRSRHTINDKAVEALERKQISYAKNQLVSEINDTCNKIVNAFYLTRVINQESKKFSDMLENLINKSYDLLISLYLSENSPNLKQDLQTLSKNSKYIYVQNK